MRGDDVVMVTINVTGVGLGDGPEVRGDDVVMVTVSMLQAEGLATDQENAR